jgi:CheY-like chemotaxis protein
MPEPICATIAASRILVADDNPTIRVITVAMLEHMGHAVDIAEDGLEALAAVRAKTFDLVLMDLMMPHMDGIEATRAIRALPGTAGSLPIIGLTANTSDEDRTACLTAGMDGFATKPISAKRLRCEIMSRLRPG